ncbi:hypothetical protein B0H14DRAFT_3502070 [Mycena olivaceomarginata]|nr:hypothetical protein B0H14DRAFT_3502070 [Mycena olivaceomarginata]
MIVHKTTSKATTNCRQVHILAYAARIPCPARLASDWFEDESATLSEGSLTTSSDPLLTVGILAGIFFYLKDDAPAFLAGVWTTSHNSTPDRCVLALRHAAAFLEAHNKEADCVLLSALVICLPSDPATRTAALDRIAGQRSLAEQRFSAVYAFDAIHGETRCVLFILFLQACGEAESDVKKYLDAMMDHWEHIALDASHVKVFHVQHMGQDNGDKMKDSDSDCAVAMCRADKSKIEVLLPVLLALSQDNRSAQPESPAEQFASLVVASFHLSASSALNDTKGPLGDVFVAIVQH